MAPWPMSFSMRKLPATTRPGRGSSPWRDGSVSEGGLMAAAWRRMITRIVNIRAELVAEADAEIARGLDRVRVEGDGLHDRDGLLDAHRHHVRGLVGDHVAELALLDHAHGGGAEAQRQEAVAVGGAAA